MLYEHWTVNSITVSNSWKISLGAPQSTMAQALPTLTFHPRITTVPSFRRLHQLPLPVNSHFSGGKSITSLLLYELRPVYRIRSIRASAESRKVSSRQFLVIFDIFRSIFVLLHVLSRNILLACSREMVMEKTHFHKLRVQNGRNR